MGSGILTWVYWLCNATNLKCAVYKYSPVTHSLRVSWHKRPLVSVIKIWNGKLILTARRRRSKLKQKNKTKNIYIFKQIANLPLHRLAVRISLPFHIFSTSLSTDPGLQLGDPAPLIGLLLWTCQRFIISAITGFYGRGLASLSPIPDLEDQATKLNLSLSFNQFGMGGPTRSRRPANHSTTVKWWSLRTVYKRYQHKNLWRSYERSHMIDFEP